MSGEMLLINPRRRRKARRANPVGRKRRPARARRRNPIGRPATSRRTLSAYARRRRNPIARAGRRIRRRRNPIGMPVSMGGMLAQFKQALVGGAGAVGIDVLMGYVNGYLPASMQRTPGRVGVGDAVKAVITVLAGKLLNKPTRGLSTKMAAGALTVQAAEIIRTFVPSTMTLGYASPSPIVRGSQRVGPIRQGLRAYTGQGTPLLSAFQSPGASPMLSKHSGGAQMREGVTSFR